MEGDNPEDFIFNPVAEDCIGLLLRKNVTCKLEITFQPKELGVRNANLVVLNEDKFRSILPLTGVGTNLKNNLSDQDINRLKEGLDLGPIPTSPIEPIPEPEPTQPTAEPTPQEPTVPPSPNQEGMTLKGGSACSLSHWVGQPVGGMGSYWFGLLGLAPMIYLRRKK